MLVNLRIGDSHRDGHGKYDDQYYEVNCENQRELLEAYSEGVKICGVNLQEDCASEYEDISITIGDFKKLYKHGILNDDDLKYAMEEYEDDIDVSFEELEDTKKFECFFCEMDFDILWLEIAKLGKPDLKYNKTSNKVPRIDIGGYGLYW